jgi:hypothetical protein
MSKRLVKGRRSVVALATAAAAVTAAGAAYASIPDSTTGIISSCYNATSGAVRVIDDPSHGSTPTCPSTEKPLVWNQIGRTGPTGMRGPQGPPGPNNMHWIKTDAAGNTTGKSDSGATVYNGTAYTYFTIPNVDPSKCAITVQATNVMFSDGPITTSYQLYGAYVYARAQQMHPNGTLDWYPKTGLDVILGC